MTISQLFYPVLSKSFTLLFISVVLTACSSEESITDSTTGADTEVVQGATPEPVPELSLETAPVATLSASPSSIDPGQSATLSWTSTNATSCTASGGWSGTRTSAGIVSVSPTVTSTYTLSCNGADGSASDSVSVTVNTPAPQEQDVNLSWAAPVERENGEPISLAEIAGYRVYYGTTQGSYPNQVDIADRNTTQVTLSNLATGTYYFVITTYDVDGRESAFSQVVTKSI